MDFGSIETCFNRALSLSFSKKKILLCFPALIVCGIILVFCRTLAFNASGWTALSLIFLPILLSACILLALGVLLVRIYHHEVKNLKVNFKELFTASWQQVVGTFYLSVPPVLIYLLLWVLLGIFLLFKEIPGVGEFIGVILAFGPFILILCTLFLCLVDLLLLFFGSPAIALKTMGKLKLAKSIFGYLRENAFKHLVMLLIALLPIALVSGFLALGWHLTNISYLEMTQDVAKSLSWFFIMVPFSAILTPSVIFFFNFSAESYNILHLSESQ